MVAAALAAVAFPWQAMAHSPVLAPRSAVAKKAPADSAVMAYVAYDPATFDMDAAAARGIRFGACGGGIATARLRVADIDALGSMPGVRYVQVASGVMPMLDIARGETGASAVQAGQGLVQGYTGRGVVVGVVDNGFDYTHRAFFDAEGNCRIKRVWEQRATATDDYSAPEDFGYGIELLTPEAIAEAQADIYHNSHGTHVATIAAGSDPLKSGAYLGMAPDAEIVLVSLGASDTDKVNVNVSNAIKYIFDYAEAEGKPCVINLSLGAHFGPHDGTSPFDMLADAMTGPGRLIVGSSGNHRADKFHVERNFAAASDSPLLTCLDFKKTGTYGGDIEVWVDNAVQPEIALSLVKKNTGEVSDRVVVWPAESAAMDVELGRYVSGTVTVASEQNPLNGKVHVLVRPDVKSVRSTHAIVVEVSPKGAGKADIWADNITVGLSSNGLEGFSEPVSASTVAEIGGTAKNILTVGAYTTRNTYVRLNETNVNSLEETIGDICSFSSEGPTADGRMKPEVAAPGCFILSAVSAYDGSGTVIVGDADNPAEAVNMFGYMQGTSMAAPMVTGVVAQWLQAYPQLTPAGLKEVVKASSRKDDYAKELPNSIWGYGKLDAMEGAKECLRLAATGCHDISVEPRGTLLKQSSEVLEVVFTSGFEGVTATLYSAVGAVAASATAAKVASSDALTLPLSVAPGIYILSVKAPGLSDTYKIAIR